MPTTIRVYSSCVAFVFVSMLVACGKCQSSSFNCSPENNLRSGTKDTTNDDASQLWNEAHFKGVSAQLAYYTLQNDSMRNNDTIHALQAIEHFTCLTFSQVSDAQKCNSYGNVCTTIDRTGYTVSTSLGSGQNQSIYSKSIAGVTSAVLASLGVHSELNRIDRENHLEIHFRMLKEDLISPKTPIAKALVTQLFLQCNSTKRLTKFDYFSITLGDALFFQEDDIPLMVTKNPKDMWKLYVQTPNSPILTAFDRYYLTKKKCSKVRSKDGEKCNPQKCTFGFLTRCCHCVCLPGYTGDRCSEYAQTTNTSQILGISLPNFPFVISSPIGWIHSGLELTSWRVPSQHRFVWSCQAEAPPHSRLHITLFMSHLTRRLLTHPATHSLAQFQLLYTHAGPTRYRTLWLAEHLPVAILTPHATQVTLLLVGNGGRPLSPLVDGSPLVVRRTPDPRFHLWLARSRHAPSVIVAHVTGTASLPSNRAIPLDDGRLDGGDGDGASTSPPPARGYPIEALRSYLPVALGVVCGLWFILLTGAILCYMRSDRSAPQPPEGAEPQPEPQPEPEPTADDSSAADGESSSSSAYSEVSSRGSSVSVPATETSAAVTSDESVHVQFVEQKVM